LVTTAIAAPGVPKIRYTMVMLNMEGDPNLVTLNSYNSYSQCIAALNSIIKTENDVINSNGFAVWCTPSSVFTSSSTRN
jgi:hypothetical protein